ncbi:glycosyl transferase family 1 [Bombiscardovia coagulans]|uniref:Glycosyl transferase family 1 n=2 Tax=Bombiscardovia coagulans TaxID=686666 RepID=A0A261EQS2_9BIFI|nr:glycosyl transferase family 1 [Bombiscardovia coagulans]
MYILQFMENKRVLIFQISSNWGGIETYISNILLPSLKNVDVIVLSSTSDATLLQRIERDNVIIKELPNPRHIFSYVKALLPCLKWADLIYANKNSSINCLPLVLSKIVSHAKIFVHAHNTQPTVNGKVKLLHYLFRPVLNLCADTELACSKAAALYLFGESKYQKFTIIKNGIDTEHFTYNEHARQRIRKELGIDDDIKLIGNVGRMTKQKNQELLIEAFAKVHKQIPKSCLLILGDGDLADQLKKQCHELSIADSVIFAGNQSDTAPYYSAMDLFVFPSIHEGLPISLIEAQTTGLPVLVSQSVTREVAITDQVRFISVPQDDKLCISDELQSDKESLHWSRAILSTINNNVKKDRSIYPQQIRLAGYDVHTSIQKLKLLLKQSLLQHG